MWVGMNKTSTSEGLRVPKDRSRIQNDLKSAKGSKSSSGIQDKHKILMPWQNHQLCEHGMRSKARAVEWITALDSSVKRLQGWEATLWGCEERGAGWEVCEAAFLLCPALVKAQESCWFSFWTALQGTCAPSEESSEESYKSRKHRKCDLHRKTEQTGSLESEDW